jgi:hypothetical protein
MKNHVFFGISSMFVLVFAAGSFAQDDISPLEDSVRRQQIQQTREDQLKQRQQVVEEQRTRQIESTEDRRMMQQDKIDDRRAEYQKNLEDRRMQYREDLENKREEMRQRWDDRKARLSERRKETIKRHTDTIARRFQAAIHRVNALADKVEARIEIVKTAGGDASEAEVSLAIAREALVNTQTAYNEAILALESVLIADNPADAIGQARILFEHVKTELREAHAALADAISLLKGRSTTVPADE